MKKVKIVSHHAKRKASASFFGFLSSLLGKAFAAIQKFFYKRFDAIVTGATTAVIIKLSTISMAFALAHPIIIGITAGSTLALAFIAIYYYIWPNLIKPFIFSKTDSHKFATGYKDEIEALCTKHNLLNAFNSLAPWEDEHAEHISKEQDFLDHTFDSPSSTSKIQIQQEVYTYMNNPSLLKKHGVFARDFLHKANQFYFDNTEALEKDLTATEKQELFNVASGYTSTENGHHIDIDINNKKLSTLTILEDLTSISNRMDVYSQDIKTFDGRSLLEGIKLALNELLLLDALEHNTLGTLVHHDHPESGGNINKALQLQKVFDENHISNTQEYRRHIELSEIFFNTKTPSLAQLKLIFVILNRISSSALTFHLADNDFPGRLALSEAIDQFVPDTRNSQTDYSLSSCLNIINSVSKITPLLTQIEDTDPHSVHAENIPHSNNTSKTQTIESEKQPLLNSNDDDDDEHEGFSP